MAKKKSPGLYKRGGVWHIHKTVFGRRLCESTKTDSLAKAEIYLAKRVDELRESVVYGARPERIFREAAFKYVSENQHKASIGDDVNHIGQLDRFIGNLPLEQVHNGTLLPFVKERQRQECKSKTINLGLATARRILNLAATEWMDDNGLTWLSTAPKITMLPVTDARSAYPLSWSEQSLLFTALPEHLRQMALFKVNTGCREQEVCQLRWEWEVEVPELNTSVFLIPAFVVSNDKRQRLVKNGEDRLVVLNSIAKSVIDSQRGQHPEFVFTFRGHHVTGMNNSAWQTARKKVGLEQVRVHDLKHTFG